MKVRSFFKPQSWFVPEVVEPKNRAIVSEDEVFALLEYTARNKLSPEKSEALSNAINSSNNHTEVARRYSELVVDTSPVNGRTILDSQNTFKRLRGIGSLTVLFFLLAAGNHVADAWMADVVEPDDGSLFMNIKKYVWDYMVPFFWGCLGSCVFLMKRIQDLAGEFEYEHERMQGWGTRILLGGILAAIVVTITSSQSIGDDITVTIDTIAFLTGLSVKVVYSGLESIINGLAAKFKGDSANQGAQVVPQEGK